MKFSPGEFLAAAASSLAGEQEGAARAQQYNDQQDMLQAQQDRAGQQLRFEQQRAQANDQAQRDSMVWQGVHAGLIDPNHPLVQPVLSRLLGLGVNGGQAAPRGMPGFAGSLFGGGVPPGAGPGAQPGFTGGMTPAPTGSPVGQAPAGAAPYGAGGGHLGMILHGLMQAGLSPTAPADLANAGRAAQQGTPQAPSPAAQAPGVAPAPAAGTQSAAAVPPQGVSPFRSLQQAQASRDFGEEVRRVVDTSNQYGDNETAQKAGGIGDAVAAGQLSPAAARTQLGLLESQGALARQSAAEFLQAKQRLAATVDGIQDPAAQKQARGLYAQMERLGLPVGAAKTQRAQQLLSQLADMEEQGTIPLTPEADDRRNARVAATALREQGLANTAIAKLGQQIAALKPGLPPETYIARAKLIGESLKDPLIQKYHGDALTDLSALGPIYDLDPTPRQRQIQVPASPQVAAAQTVPGQPSGAPTQYRSVTVTETQEEANARALMAAAHYAQDPRMERYAYGQLMGYVKSPAFASLPAVQQQSVLETLGQAAKQAGVSGLPTNLTPGMTPWQQKVVGHWNDVLAQGSRRLDIMNNRELDQLVIQNSRLDQIEEQIGIARARLQLEQGNAKAKRAAGGTTAHQKFQENLSLLGQLTKQYKDLTGPSGQYGMAAMLMEQNANGPVHQAANATLDPLRNQIEALKDKLGLKVQSSQDAKKDLMQQWRAGSPGAADAGQQSPITINIGGQGQGAGQSAGGRNGGIPQDIHAKMGAVQQNLLKKINPLTKQLFTPQEAAAAVNAARSSGALH